MARPKGSKNQKTIDWNEFGKKLTEDGLPRLQRILETCDDETFIKLYVVMLEYFKPKMKRLEVADAEATPTKIVVCWDEPAQLKE